MVLDVVLFLSCLPRLLGQIVRRLSRIADADAAAVGPAD